MTAHSDFKLLREKKLDKSTTLKVSQNLMSGRIFVEFACNSPKVIIMLQKNFQDTIEGKKKADEFSKSIRNTEQLKDYFGLKKKEEK